MAPPPDQVAGPSPDYRSRGRWPVASLRERREREVGHRIELVDYHRHVRRRYVRLVVPDPWDGWCLRRDLVVDLSPFLRSLVGIVDQLGLVHGLVNRLVVQQRPVGV